MGYFVLKRRFRFLCLFSVLTLLTQCGDEDRAKSLGENEPVEKLYNYALDILTKDKTYKKAAEAFEDVARQHPLSPWAFKAEIMAAYAYYEAQKYEDALANLDDFLKLQPFHAYAPYAYYLKGMCYYMQLAGVNRDQNMTQNALAAFDVLIKNFPNSSYARDARLKRDLCKEHLAGHDMEIGRFYERTSLPLAALDRFNHVISAHESTSHVPEALYRMVEVMLKLNMGQQAGATAAVLGYNYPGNIWYERTYALLQDLNLIPADAKVPARES